MQNRKIYLARHGRIANDGNSDHRYIGQIDVPLSAEGIRQAALLRQALARQEIGHIFSSDLTRSAHTAAIIAAGRGVTPVSRADLREIAMGQWEGKTLADIARQCPADYAERGRNIVNYRIPGGESFADCQNRINAALAEILASTAGNVLIVGHAGINRLLLCQALGMPVAGLFRIGQDYGCLNILVNSDRQYRVQLLNAWLGPTAAAPDCGYSGCCCC